MPADTEFDADEGSEPESGFVKVNELRSLSLRRTAARGLKLFFLRLLLAPVLE